MPGLSPEGVRRFYERFGAKQDAQAFYEDPAIEELISHSSFRHAHAVLEFGCGTGRLAERLLSKELPPRATYLGLDVSSTMVRLAAARLAPFDGRAAVRLGDGSIRLPGPDHGYDRVVSTYVTDLLPEADVGRLLREARRVLAEDGRLCLVGLARGAGLVTGIVSRAWAAVYALRPGLVGGCRPSDLRPALREAGFTIAYHAVIAAWGISSEAVVATP